MSFPTENTECNHSTLGRAEISNTGDRIQTGPFSFEASFAEDTSNLNPLDISGIYFGPPLAVAAVCGTTEIMADTGELHRHREAPAGAVTSMSTSMGSPTHPFGEEKCQDGAGAAAAAGRGVTASKGGVEAAAHRTPTKRGKGKNGSPSTPAAAAPGERVRTSNSPFLSSLYPRGFLEVGGRDAMEQVENDLSPLSVQKTTTKKKQRSSSPPPFSSSSLPCASDGGGGGVGASSSFLSTSPQVMAPSSSSLPPSYSPGGSSAARNGEGKKCEEHPTAATSTIATSSAIVGAGEEEAEEEEELCGICLEKPPVEGFVRLWCCNNILCVKDAQHIGRCPFCRTEPLVWCIEK